jgi:hypothetical protein
MPSASARQEFFTAISASADEASQELTCRFVISISATAFGR